MITLKLNYLIMQLKIIPLEFLTDGEKLYFITTHDSDLNLISIEQIDDPYASSEKSSKKIKSKFPGITIEIEGDEIIMIDRRGEYSGFIEDNGTVSFSVVYDDNDLSFSCSETSNRSSDPKIKYNKSCNMCDCNDLNILYGGDGLFDTDYTYYNVEATPIGNARCFIRNASTEF